MTSRVIDCHARGVEIPPPRAARRSSRPPTAPVRGLKSASAGALLLVPIAGAAEPPLGWFVAGLTAVAMLALGAAVGRHVPWGWLMVGVACVAVVTPRGNLAVMGPGLFVATVICLLLWLANPRPGRRREAGSRPRLSEAEREAQLLMGISGERHVGHVLARELPQDFVLINGLKLPRGAGDIDHLVVGPTGVFLLES